VGGSQPGTAGEPTNVAGESGFSGRVPQHAECIRNPWMSRTVVDRPDTPAWRLKERRLPDRTRGRQRSERDPLWGLRDLETRTCPRTIRSLAHELARGELSGDNVGGLPDGPTACGRPAGDDRLQHASVVAPGLEHLINDVQVPAVIATLKARRLREGYREVPTAKYLLT